MLPRIIGWLFHHAIPESICHEKVGDGSGGGGGGGGGGSSRSSSSSSSSSTRAGVNTLLGEYTSSTADAGVGNCPLVGCSACKGTPCL